MIIGFKLYRNNFSCSKLNATFKVVEVNFGSKSCNFSYRYLAVLKISGKSGAHSCSTRPLSRKRADGGNELLCCRPTRLDGQNVHQAKKIVNFFVQ